MGMRWSVGRILAVVTMLAIAGFWAAIFAGLPKRANPDFLEDRAFARQTESLCAAMVADLADLPNGAFIEDAGNVDLLLRRQTAHEGRRRRPFQMQVQFDLRQVHRTPLPGPCDGTPRCAATVAATSAKAIWPRPPAPAPAMATGTRSRVWSVPVHVGSLP